MFRVTTNGLLTTLATFAVTNGQSPHAGLTWGPGGLFYGTTASGGPFGDGTIFSVTTSGTLTMLTNFNNANGNAPTAGLTLGLDGNLYGVAQSGGSHSAGTVFKVTPNGILTNLYYFGSTTTDGASPQTTLTLGPDGNLYGATAWTSLATFDFNGTLYKITTNGTLTTLINFDFYNGGNPIGSLTLGPDGSFYGTTYLGDNGNGSNMGIVYSLTTNRVFTVVAQFDASTGAYPISGLTLGPDNNFYGGTTGNGAYGNGTIYRLGLSPIFVTDPASQSVVIGNSATFSSQMFGTAPFAFQWWSNSVPAAGATGGSLNLRQVFYQANNAQFQVVVTNSYGSVTSQVANLSVVLQPNCAVVVNNGAGNYNVVVGSYPSSLNHLWATTNLSSSWQQIAPITTDANGMGSISIQARRASRQNFTGCRIHDRSASWKNLSSAQRVQLKNRSMNRLTLFVLLVWFALVGVPNTDAQPFTTLFSFGKGPANPRGNLALGPDGNFYGTTYGGGQNYDGTAFRVTPGGTLTTLASFGGYLIGSWPYAGLALGADGNFYGTTIAGGTNSISGTNNTGTIFRMTTNGTLTTLVSFTGFNGSYPAGQLVIGPDGSFYGTTAYGGISNNGTVFRVTTNGVLTTLASFTGTNGATPMAGLTLGLDGSFYGTTVSGGGTNNLGTIFRVTTNGNLTTLVMFTGNYYTNNVNVFLNGLSPYGQLILGTDGKLYGTTAFGGNPNGDFSGGTVFQVTTNGALTTLIYFSAFGGINGDSSYAQLFQGADGNFYGTTSSGGANGSGTVFQVTTNGTLAQLANLPGFQYIVVTNSQGAAQERFI